MHKSCSTNFSRFIIHTRSRTRFSINSAHLSTAQLNNDAIVRIQAAFRGSYVRLIRMLQDPNNIRAPGQVETNVITEAEKQENNAPITKTSVYSIHARRVSNALLGMIDRLKEHQDNDTFLNHLSSALIVHGVHDGEHYVAYYDRTGTCCDTPDPDPMVYTGLKVKEDTVHGNTRDWLRVLFKETISVAFPSDHEIRPVPVSIQLKAAPLMTDILLINNDSRKRQSKVPSL